MKNYTYTVIENDCVDIITIVDSDGVRLISTDKSDFTEYRPDITLGKSGRMSEEIALGFVSYYESSFCFVMPLGSTVKYNGEIYFLYGATSNGSAKLLDKDGNKFSGTPSIEKLTLVKQHACVVYNNISYYKTKKGFVSSKTGTICKERYAKDIVRLGVYA